MHGSPSAQTSAAEAAQLRPSSKHQAVHAAESQHHVLHVPSTNAALMQLGASGSGAGNDPVAFTDNLQTQNAALLLIEQRHESQKCHDQPYEANVHVRQQRPQALRGEHATHMQLVCSAFEAALDPEVVLQVLQASGHNVAAAIQLLQDSGLRRKSDTAQFASLNTWEDASMPAAPAVHLQDAQHELQALFATQADAAVLQQVLASVGGNIDDAKRMLIDGGLPLATSGEAQAGSGSLHDNFTASESTALGSAAEEDSISRRVLSAGDTVTDSNHVGRTRTGNKTSLADGNERAVWNAVGLALGSLQGEKRAAAMQVSSWPPEISWVALSCAYLHSQHASNSV